MTVRMFEVGGCVRDSLMGLTSKDVDFTVEAPSFDAMRAHLLAENFRIFVEKAEFVTIRAAVPAGHKLRERTKDADFVLARRDGPTLDGRRPEFTEPGTLADDIARRDFTVNALARDPFTGQIIDLVGGVADIDSRTLRFVGNPMDRIREDGLRVLRGLRFMVTKKLTATPETMAAILSDEAARMLGCVSIERTRDEVEKMFAFDTLEALHIFRKLPEWTTAAIFRSPLRLSATLKEGVSR
jgi:tRNA nucleotidyltransferase/poly(A) polymerase